MPIEVDMVHDCEGGLADCDLRWDGVAVDGVVVTSAIAAGAVIDGEVELDEIMGVRDAEARPAGPWVEAGSGFIAVIGQVERILDWGSSDVRSGDQCLMLDDDELCGWQPTPGAWLSIACKRILVTPRAG